jgi:hypothetical protein
VLPAVDQEPDVDADLGRAQMHCVPDEVSGIKGEPGSLHGRVLWLRLAGRGLGRLRPVRFGVKVLWLARVYQTSDRLVEIVEGHVKPFHWFLGWP